MRQREFGAKRLAKLDATIGLHAELRRQSSLELQGRLEQPGFILVHVGNISGVISAVKHGTGWR
jgi:hypothetical protein